MRYFSIAIIPLLAAGLAGAADYTSAPNSARVRCVVAIAEQADLSPREPGILKDDPVAVGRHIDAGQLVLQLDDTKAQQELNVAKAKQFAAVTKAEDDVNIKYSEAAAKVAKSDLDFAEKANRDVPGTVPQGKINELTLKCIETSLAIDKAKHDREVARAEADIAKAEVHAAETMVELLKVKSPIDGEVVEVRAHKGEAVQPTQPGVIHVVGLSKLWVEGPVLAADFSREQLENQPVTVEVSVSRTEKKTIPGKIIFVSPLTESGGSYLVRAEVQKQGEPLPLHPGMQVEMVIPVKQ
jgi:multidrug efflux pump subunit AcrA (membrane-fusion protein)